MNTKDNSKQQNFFENEEKAEMKDAPKKFNILDVAAAESVESPLEVVRLGNDETAILPFTAESVEVDIHYCPETEINSYLVCNGPDCILCRIGRRRDQRLLLPVYLLVAGCVGILPVSRSLRPFALLPQISHVLKAEKPMVMFVTREMAKYNVSTTELQKDVDGGEAIIKRFIEDNNAGLHDLTSVYPKIDNEQLACVEEIGRMMALKGIRWDDGNKRS